MNLSSDDILFTNFQHPAIKIKTSSSCHDPLIPPLSSRFGRIPGYREI